MPVPAGLNNNLCQCACTNFKLGRYDHESFKSCRWFEELRINSFTFFPMLIHINLYAILAILVVVQTTSGKDFVSYGSKQIKGQQKNLNNTIKNTANLLRRLKADQPEIRMKNCTSGFCWCQSIPFLLHFPLVESKVLINECIVILCNHWRERSRFAS